MFQTLIPIGLSLVAKSNRKLQIANRKSQITN